MKIENAGGEHAFELGVIVRHATCSPHVDEGEMNKATLMSLNLPDSEAELEWEEVVQALREEWPGPYALETRGLYADTGVESGPVAEILITIFGSAAGIVTADLLKNIARRVQKRIAAKTHRTQDSLLEGAYVFGDARLVKWNLSRMTGYPPDCFRPLEFRRGAEESQWRFENIVTGSIYAGTAGKGWISLEVASGIPEETFDHRETGDPREQAGRDIGGRSGSTGAAQPPLRED